LEAKFTKHTAMEIGHDELALDDLRQLGVDPEPVRNGRPMPVTEAMSAFIIFQIQHRNPAAYLGYLYHLEALPTHAGGNILGTLAKMGVPDSATSFLREHAEADMVHVKWNREYLEGFIRTEADLEAAVYGMRGTCELHALMFAGILDQSRDWKPAPASNSVPSR
jgi:pyrroloquinoline quinone (PQQ) biosynthesis protein C